MFLVDIRETPSAKAADVFLQIRPGKDFELINVLRALIKGQRVNDDAAAEVGVTMEQLRELVDMMKAARFGVISVWVVGGGIGLWSPPTLRAGRASPFSGHERVLLIPLSGVSDTAASGCRIVRDTDIGRGRGPSRIDPPSEGTC